MTPLLPCPWCRCPESMLQNNGDLAYWRVCTMVACGAEGPVADSAEAADERWNRRAPGVVKDCLTTGYAAGAEAMRERAAAEIDCGCSWRDAALAATNKGERFVACGNDPCGAIEARAIRALPIPEPAAALKARA